MFETLKSLVARLRVKWHVVAVAFVTAVPALLDQLHYIDLKPILSHFMPADQVDTVIGLLPFALIFLDKVVHTEEHPADAVGV